MKFQRIQQDPKIFKDILICTRPPAECRPEQIHFEALRRVASPVKAVGTAARHGLREARSLQSFRVIQPLSPVLIPPEVQKMHTS